MNRILMLVVAFVIATPGYANTKDRDESNERSCYSVYHLQQKMKLSVTFGQSIQHQNTKLDLDFHVREIMPESKTLSKVYKESKERNIRSFIALINFNDGQSNGIQLDMSERYRHPFLIFTDGETGEIIDLWSTSKNQSIFNEYLSFFDFFQYSRHNGDYAYQNGNGIYNARITSEKNDRSRITKENLGYLKSDDDNNGAKQVQESYLTMGFDDQRSECFYKTGRGIETFKTTQSAQAFVEGEATIDIRSDKKRVLPASHFFHSLTDDLKLWPDFRGEESITEKEAFDKFPIFMAQLSSVLEDDSRLLETMLSEMKTWPYLADYILKNKISNELSLQLFWALNKINNTESVSALTHLVTSPLSNRDHLRAVLALGSTSAPFDEQSLELLKNHMSNFQNLSAVQDESLTFVRMLGAMSSNRRTTDPENSNDIKYFLYAQVGSYDETVNAAVIDAIGNLKNNIDREGENILLNELFSESDVIRLSTVSAFERVPYNSRFGNVFIDKLKNENNMEIKNTLIKVLGQAENNDLTVKQELLSIVQNTKSSKLTKSSLESLKKIDYVYLSDDMGVLEEKLRQETDPANQKLLASIILKYRQR